MFEDKLEKLEDTEKILSVYSKLQKKADKTEQKILEDLDQKLDILKAYKRIESTYNRLKQLKNTLDKKVAEEFPSKEEGSQTTKAGDFKVTTTGRKYYRVDEDELDVDELPEIAQHVFREKKKVSKSDLNDLENVDPKAHKEVMKYINVNQGKTGVDVEHNG